MYQIDAYDFHHIRERGLVVAWGTIYKEVFR